MFGVILAAGMAKRLRPLTDTQPKCLLTVGGRTLLERTVEAMRQAGIAYATDQIIDLFANGFRTVHVYSMNNPTVAGAIMANLSKILE